MLDLRSALLTVVCLLILGTAGCNSNLARNADPDETVADISPHEFDADADLWARVLYDMAIGYRDGVCDPDLMMESLIPLYFGRTFSFVKRTKRMSARQAEEAIEEDCMTFEMTKPYLVSRWNKKKST